MPSTLPSHNEIASKDTGTEGLVRPALFLFIVLSLVTGLFYPLVVTGIAQAAFPEAAGGSLIVRNGQAVGSALIGQSFSDSKNFWGRPSATGPMSHNAEASGGSNLGPTNPALVGAVKVRIDALHSSDPGNTAAVPVDLVTASASGLDPHISRAAADYQVQRVAAARGLPVTEVQGLVDAHTDWPWLGFLGEARVHVLALNLALDAHARR